MFQYSEKIVRLLILRVESFRCLNKYIIFHRLERQIIFARDKLSFSTINVFCVCSLTKINIGVFDDEILFVLYFRVHLINK